MELDEAQREAAEAGAGRLLIVAPPGSGKTRTLIERISRLIENGAAPERILALTFTNKAANEMRERLLRRGGSAAAPHASTFHSLALEMLRTDGSAIGIAPDFEIVEDEKEKSGNALTFDELLSHALKLLEENPDARSRWQSRFDHVLVDEYQDTDDRQEKLLAILCEPHGNLCVIGDPNQAIYGFRGANVGNFLSFVQTYPAARHVALSTNYRSTPLLVQAAHAIVGGARPQAARREQGEKIVLKECASSAGEARWIVQQIEKLIGGMYHESGAHDAAYTAGDIAVLFRFKAIGKELEKAFAEAGIPYLLVTPENLDEVEFETFRVPLMTMHAGKGLEFPVVFIAGLEDGVVPYLKDDADLAEERRLFYVAMTRAKDRLFLSHAKHRTLFGQTFSEPSRFIKEIPDECLATEAREKPKAYQKKLF